MVVVRVPKNDGVSLTTALDAGAAAITIPHCESAEGVENFKKESFFGMKSPFYSLSWLPCSHIPTKRSFKQVQLGTDHLVHWHLHLGFHTLCTPTIRSMLRLLTITCVSSHRSNLSKDSQTLKRL
jgi:hypothetical protein